MHEFLATPRAWLDRAQAWAGQWSASGRRAVLAGIYPARQTFDRAPWMLTPVLWPTG
ncbi:MULTISPECIES: hypothetical protein [Leptolyngbya]|uniref:hypothetical protein n=1 Tax=Leptolyngbya TaxID=47251 RepID=UPI0003699995|nr:MULTISPECIES: hypothetical protein [Leptolyngbya]MBD2372865.1 hypothetical protein [Leptolyngbya sp. FACHB-238]MBD2397382.1 hypothetical protein [Leptolyngbya sp. FACHB-239]MBD2403813.1 hypothetical protein [Leptolyngbya sp. FACHB-402]ULP33469.1 hypothetical protein MCP04_30535 [Leptolyngbya boryana IU 594]